MILYSGAHNHEDRGRDYLNHTQFCKRLLFVVLRKKNETKYSLLKLRVYKVVELTIFCC